MAIVRITSKSGSQYEFEDGKMAGAGGMKDVYFSPDKKYVVGFFRSKPDPTARQRLEKIVNQYRAGIFDSAASDYWQSRFCWPTDVVEYQGKVGVVAPTYPQQFFFQHGSINGDFLGIKGNEKEGKWFASAKLRRHLDPAEKGTWKEYLRQSLNLARAVRRMHAAGLAHSDLSYKNVLVDPTSGDACIIDIDGLVVPGMFPPEVVGTPDFIAPEVIRTAHLDIRDPNRFLPSANTDKHALAILIYMYMFYRHPLRGGKVHDQDPQKDEEAMMGAKAVFIEHPSDKSNRVNPKSLAPSEDFWGDPSKISYKAAGPHLAALFERAFIDGLHDPSKRPMAMEWESALIKTLDMIQPCSNKNCEMKWYVFDNTTTPICPGCRTPYSGPLPVLDMYKARDGKQFRPENHRLMVWDGQSLFMYHVNHDVTPNENLKPEHKKRVGYFQKISGDWYLVNEALPTLTDVTDKDNHQVIPIGAKVKLVAGLQLKLSSDPTGRLLLVSIANS